MIKSGATFGAGIYLYPHSSEAIKHAGSNENKYTNSQLGKQLSVIALCEIPDLPWGIDVTVQVEEQEKPLNGVLREFDNDKAFTLTLEQACMIRILLVNCDTNVDVKTGIQKVPTLNECMNSNE